MPIPSSKRKVNSKICQNSTGWLLKSRLKIQQVAYISLQLIKFECCNSSAGNTIEKWAKFAYHMISRSLTFLIWWHHKNPIWYCWYFFILKRRFLHSLRSLHSLRVAQSSASATPKGTPAFAPDFAPLRSLPSLHSLTKSLFKIKKISNIKLFLWYHQS